MDKVKQRIIELLPDVDWGVEERTDGMWKREVGLADVLRAIEAVGYAENLEYTINTVGYIESRSGRTGMITHEGEWNLTADYDNQTQDIKDFIGKLLGISNVTG